MAIYDQPDRLGDRARTGRRPRRVPALGAAVLGLGLAIAGGCGLRGAERSGEASVAGQVAGGPAGAATSESRPKAAAGGASAAPSPRALASPREPGRGVVAGRLIDSATGLPVPDVQVQLIETGRRTLSGANGTFRFDGVPAGELTVALGPSDAHVTGSRRAVVGSNGYDFGLVPLIAADAPTYVAPELGGTAAGCAATRVDIPPNALDEAVAMRVTCLPDERAFPAPAPAGRLPLAVVDIAPGERMLTVPATVTLSLPAQPRYAAGVVLDVLQLDYRRLRWDRIGSAVVDGGGETAHAVIGTLAPLMLVAPAFGAVGAAADAPPTVTRYNVAALADGEPVDAFPVGTIIVYAGFDFGGMANTTVRVKTTDPSGAVRFESRRPYTDAGRDNVPMIDAGGAPWPVGDYLTTWSIGEPPVAVGKSVAWSVSAQPTPGPTAVAVVIAPDLARDGVSVDAPYGESGLPPRAVPAGALDCGRPPGWVEYTVQAGDTLSGLSLRTGIEVGTLMHANCLSSDTIYAGRLLYMPRFPAKPAYQGAWPPAYDPGKPPVGGPWPATPVPSTGGAPRWPTKAAGPPPTLAPLPFPTTWYTPPPPAPAPGDVGGDSAGGRGGSMAPPAGGSSGPAPYVPPAPAPTRIPAKDPSPAEPTLAPRPMP